MTSMKIPEKMLLEVCKKPTDVPSPTGKRVSHANSGIKGKIGTIVKANTKHPSRLARKFEVLSILRNNIKLPMLLPI